MIENKCIRYITIINCFTIAILSIRFQELVLILASIGVLLYYSIIRPTRIGIGALSFSLTFLYPGPQFGWLYIRGAHVAAYTAEEILNNGWPVSTTIRRSTPGTPLVHFHAVLGSKITDLAIYPSTNAELLITAILPIVFSLVSLLMAFLIIRRYQIINQISVSRYSLFAPILIWAPFFMTKPAFNRQSIGFLFFISTSYTIFLLIHNNDWRYIVLALTFCISTIMSHDFASVSTILLLSSVFLITIYVQNTRKCKGFPNSAYTLLPISIILFFSWQIIGKFGITRISSAFLGITTDRFSRILAFSSSDGQTQIPSAVGEPIQLTISTMFQNLFSDFLYAIVIGVGITICLIDNILNDRGEKWVETVFVFGVFTGSLSIFSWILGIGISPDRIITYLVFVGGGISLLGYLRLGRKFNRLPISNIVVIVLLGLSISMIPLHVVSEFPPQYEQGETDQRFSKALYAAADFTNYHVRTTIYGDENVEHVIGGKTGKLINSRPEIFSSHNVPEDSVLVLQNYNEKYYFGASLNYESIGFRPNGYIRVTKSNDRLYSNGNVSIYS